MEAICRRRALAMDLGLNAALRAASAVPADDQGHSVAITLLSVADGIEASLNRSSWDLDSLCATVGIMGRMAEGAATTRVVLGAFFAQQQWRDRFCDCCRRLNQLLPQKKAAEQRRLALAWPRLALLASEEELTDKYTMMRIELPLQQLVTAINDLVGRSTRETFDGESRKALGKLLSRLADAHRKQLGGQTGGQGSSAPDGGRTSAQAAWVTSQLTPTDGDLNSRTCFQPNPNRIKGEYESAHEYLGTHFHLLREDFVRPLRQAIEALREGAELPREVKLWDSAILAGMNVGNPGGVLFKVIFALERPSKRS